MRSNLIKSKSVLKYARHVKQVRDSSCWPTHGRQITTQRWRSYLRLPPQVWRRHPLRDGGARAARRPDGGALSEEAILLLLFHFVPDGEDDVAQLVDEVDVATVAAPCVILLLAALIRSLIQWWFASFLFCCFLPWPLWIPRTNAIYYFLAVQNIL